MYIPLGVGMAKDVRSLQVGEGAVKEAHPLPKMRIRCNDRGGGSDDPNVLENVNTYSPLPSFDLSDHVAQPGDA